jgi:hypothetical protein
VEIRLLIKGVGARAQARAPFYTRQDRTKVGLKLQDVARSTDGTRGKIEPMWDAGIAGRVYV